MKAEDVKIDVALFFMLLVEQGFFSYRFFSAFLGSILQYLVGTNFWSVLTNAPGFSGVQFRKHDFV